MSLVAAIVALQEEIDSFNHGTQQQPKEGTTAWFMLRAKSIGMSYLKRLEQLGVENNPAASEGVRREAGKLLKRTEVPPEPLIVKETLPPAAISKGLQ